MNVLVVGSGGREHALCLRLSQDASVERVLAAPGNPGMAEVGDVFDVDASDADALGELCLREGVELVVIGPERPLIAGVAEALRAKGIAVFGPSAACARIEGSKAFAKEMMAKAGVPTANAQTFTDFDDSEKYIREHWPVVVKASGEALGKGVVVSDDIEEAVTAAREMLSGQLFGDAGRTIVVEERLSGTEASLLAICSAESYFVLPTAQDYKRVYEGDKGPNTGGMGAISPSIVNVDGLGELFIAPILRAFVERGTPYIGTLYAGLMMTKDGPKCLEYNARFGDPETQVILPRIDGDFAAALLAAARSEPFPALREKSEHAICVVIAAKGYPGEYAKGVPLPDLSRLGDVTVIHAGTKLRNGVLVSSGGRVVGIVGVGDHARERVYDAAGKFSIEDWHYRTDIGAPGIT